MVNDQKRAQLVIEQLKEANAGINDADLSAKYGKMRQDAFVFYRGTNHLYWMDFGRDRRLSTFGNDLTRCWLSGDCHAENFGAFFNDKLKLIYGMNDFDESVFADYQYDLWRLAVSVVLIARRNQAFDKAYRATNKLDKADLPRSAQEAAIDALARSYRSTMRDFRGNDDENKRIFDARNTYGLLDNFLDDVEKKKSPAKMFDKWAPDVDGTRRFNLDLRDDPPDDSVPLLGPTPENVKAAILAEIPNYGARLDAGKGDIKYDEDGFEVLDIATRLNAGTGSLGTDRFYVLLAGPKDGDEVLLDVKQQEGPTALAYLGQAFRDFYANTYKNHAQRETVALQALGKHPDDYSGWMQLPGGSFSVRQRSPWKKTFDTEKLSTQTRLTKMAEQWAAMLATDHAYADKLIASDASKHTLEDEFGRLTKGKKDEFASFVIDIAFAYADQVEQDYQVFKASDL